MRLRVLILALLAPAAAAQQPFTLEQILSAPYSTDLTAAPAPKSGPALFAWVEHTEGRNNLWVGGPSTPARQLTHNTEDDAQDITQLAWSPDASAIAYTFGAASGAGGKPANPAHLQHPTPVQIILQPLTPNAPPTLIGEGRSPLFETLNHHLLFIRSGQIYIACLPAPAKAIQDNACHPERSEVSASPGPPPNPEVPHQLVFDRGAATSLTLSPDGTLLAFLSRRRSPNAPAHSYLALFNLLTHELTFPAPSTANDSAPTFSPEGHQLAFLRSPFTQPPEYANPRTSPNPWSIQLLDLPQNCHPDPEHREGEGSASSACSSTISAPRTLFTPTPNQPGSLLPHLATGEPRLFWTSTNRLIFYSEADGWLHLYSLDPTSARPPQLLTPGPFEVEDANLDSTKRLLFWASNDKYRDPLGEDHRHIWQFNLAYPGEAPKQRPIGNSMETHPTPAADGSALAALVSDAQTPIHPALIEGNITPLHPGAIPSTYPAAALVLPTQILFPSTDNTQLHAQLFLPPNLSPNQKHPAILFLHGGPNRQMLLGYPDLSYYSNAYAFNQYLTSRGFIVLSLNYRCGIGYGLDFRQCLHAGPNGAAEYNDVLAAQRYLASRTDVDPARIGLWGGSYGGYLTALALARNSNLFAAGVDFHGVHDWNLEDNASDWKVGPAPEQAALAARALASSPLADITHWHSPILLIHGDDDPDVAYAQTPTLADALRARNTTLPPTQQVTVQELIFPDELHGFLLHRDWLAAYTAAAAFFERTLNPNPVK